VIVVADSSPLIVLAKLRYFDFLSKLYSRLCISTEVHYEVVVAGAGLPGAAEVENANWIEVKPLQNKADLLTAQQRCSLGAGLVS
jgi:predicted nucleic acid-binding protein